MRIKTHKFSNCNCFICGEITASFDVEINPRKPTWQNRFLSSLGKVTCRIGCHQDENICPTCPPGGSKNIILCFLANKRYIRDSICTGYITKAGKHQGIHGKKDQNLSINKLINQLTCMNAEIKRGRRSGYKRWDPIRYR